MYKVYATATLKNGDKKEKMIMSDNNYKNAINMFYDLRNGVFNDWAVMENVRIVQMVEEDLTAELV